ncbi:MAG: DNA repair protein RecO [Bacteroidales bacterium]|nr:DNA repair protein RecO [Bacteroidales bacterium]
MLQKTKGIILNSIKYSDSSIITNIYTENFGRQSYIVSGTHNKKSKTKINIFQPLFILNLDVYYKPSREIQRIKEAKIFSPLKTIPYDIVKSSTTIFLSEILSKVLYEQTPNKDLFEFLINSIKIFDTIENGKSNFHLLFLLKLSKHLGFEPNIDDSINSRFFDLVEGKLVDFKPAHNHHISEKHHNTFRELLNKKYENLHDIKLNNHTRRYFLEKIVEYYKIHIPGIKEIKSLEVLNSLFNT